MFQFVYYSHQCSSGFYDCIVFLVESEKETSLKLMGIKTKISAFLVGFLLMGFVYGVILYFFEDEFSIRQIIYQALIFGFGWGLAEVFVFPCVRKKFGKNKS